MTTAVLLFLSLYNLISCSSEQLERMHLYNNNFISLGKYFPVSSDTNLLNIGLYWPNLKWDRTLGSQRNPAHKLSVHYHAARKSILSMFTCAAERVWQIKTWVKHNVWFCMIAQLVFLFIITKFIIHINSV